jgi:hypothetical protein
VASQRLPCAIEPSWFGGLVPIELAATKEMVAHHGSGKYQKYDGQDHYD